MVEAKDGEKVELLCDVDLAGIASWEPVNLDVAFEFDGKGYTISNLTINKDGDIVGFIGSARDDLYIHDVTFDGASVTASSGAYHAIVAAQLDTDADYAISNVAVVNSTLDAQKYVGAVVGHASIAITFTDIVVKDNTIKGNDAQCGALCGYGEGHQTVVNAEISGNTITGGTKIGAVWGRCNAGKTFTNLKVNQPANAFVGSFFAGTVTVDGKDTTINVGSFYNTEEGTGTASITAGTWSIDPTAYVADGYEADKQGDVWVVMKPLAIVIAADGSTTTKYDDLAVAIAAVKNGETLELLSDVDLAGVEWTPCKTFNGTFDGKGFKVKNLAISTAESTSYVGFIGTTGNDSYVKNLTLDNVNISAVNAQFVGAVVGGIYESSRCEISNVCVTGTVIVDGYKYVGGIMGHRHDSSVYDCHVDGTNPAVSHIRCCGDEDQVGGINGQTGEQATWAKNCSVCNITISGPERVGGIIGRNHHSARIANCSVDNVIIKGTRDVGEGRIGGIVGTSQDNTQFVLNCTVNDVTILDANDAELPYTDIGYITGSVLIVGTGVEGIDAMSFTAGTFKTYNDTDNATLKKYIATGYALKDNGDNTYTTVPVFNVTIDDQIVNGTVAADKTTAEEGETITLTVTPAESYELESITANGGDVTLTPVVEGTTYTFTMPAAAVTVTATFKSATPAWPEDWPKDADPDVQAKFADWSKANPGVDFSLPAVQNAFLMNVAADGQLPELKIDSITVEGDTATIVVGTDTDGFDLGTVNGVLFVSGTDDLAGEWTTTEVAMPTGEVGETATFTVEKAKFMKAKVGFKAETPVNE